MSVEIKRIALLMPDSYVYAHEYFSRFRTASGRAVWDGTEFIANPSAGVFDGVVVVQSTRPLDRVYNFDVPANRSLLAVLEPPDILFLPSGYVQQFGAVIGCDWRWNYVRRLNGPAGYGWFVETNISEFDHAGRIRKPRLLSAVISSKRDTKQHQNRLAFMAGLKSHFGDKLDWFGRGINELGGRKLDGLLDYQYHIVIENGCWNNYWTEKIADAYVANCFPFYCGAPNIAKFFPQESMEIISLDDVQGAIANIETAISASRHQLAQPFLSQARHLLANKYHPYQLYKDYLNCLPAGQLRSHIFHPHDLFGFSMRDRLCNKLWHQT